MLEALVSAAVFATLAVPAVIPPAQVPPDQPLGTRWFQQAAETQGPPAPAPRVPQAPSPRRDPLKNGAIIGAIAGAAAGALLAAVGCGMGDVYGGEDTSSCVGGTMLLVGMSAGSGALIGVGVDALFEQGPSPGLSSSGKRAGMRIRFAF